ncbi:MAG: hypothetical protein JW828_01630 [Sedimentisphaerales bacterium]|nr:hypothetical protein [Sedimentisphaerales bacterium]
MLLKRHKFQAMNHRRKARAVSLRSNSCPRRRGHGPRQDDFCHRFACSAIIVWAGPATGKHKEKNDTEHFI